MVQSGDDKSDFQFIEHGVPQGSSLSSPEIPLNGQIEMYADDTILIYSCDTLQQLHNHIQKDLMKLNEWMYNNDLSFNATKTKYILFTKNLQTFRNVHNYQTRRRDDFVIPITRGNILYNSSLVKGLAQYNQLPSQ